MKNHKQANLTIHGQQADRGRPSCMSRWDRDPDPDWGRRVSADPPGRRHPASGVPPGVSATMAVGTDRRCVPGDPHSRRSVRHTKHGESPVRTGEIGPFIGTSAQILRLITTVVTGIVATVQNSTGPRPRGGSQESVFRNVESCRQPR